MPLEYMLLALAHNVDTHELLAASNLDENEFDRNSVSAGLLPPSLPADNLLCD